MAFQNVIQTSLLEDENELKRQRILADISKYGVELDIVKKELKEYEDKEKDIDKFNEEITEKLTDLSLLKTNIELLKNDLEKRISDKNGIEIKISELRKEVLQINDGIQNLQEERQSLLSELSLIKKELFAFVGVFDSKKKITEQELLKLDSEIKVKELLTSNLSNKIVELNNDIKSLEERKIFLNKDNDKVENDINEAIKKLNTIKSEIGEQEATQKDELNKFADKKREIDEYVKKSEEEVMAKKKELEKHEGDIGLRENWLKEKTETLRKSKEELEKFFNRKINNVII